MVPVTPLRGVTGEPQTRPCNGQPRPFRHLSAIAGPIPEWRGHFCLRNRLFFVECKTKRLVGDNLAAAAIYKLDALRKAGGLRIRGILVSFRRVRDGDKRRAEEANIKVIDQAGLPRLKELLAAAIR